MTFRHIGEGACGSIWLGENAPTKALKRQKPTNLRSIQQDSQMHQKVEQAFSESRAQHPGRFDRITLPRHGHLVSGGDWWRENASRFPAQYEDHPHDILVTERIPAFKRPVREQIIDLYCPENAKETIRANARDEDCLVRPYLGRKERPRRTPLFTLRNKQLTINNLRELDLPLEEYSLIMAETLAVMLWHARTDANDVEFVLAPAGPNTSPQSIFQSEVLGSHCVWLLDFDCVREITLDEDGVDQAAVAFYTNDPYSPRPGMEDEEDQKMWKLFSGQFAEASRLILGPESELPRMFLRRVEELAEERRQKISQATLGAGEE